MKIITRRTAEEAGDQWLTEEDTKSFRELLINLLVITILKNQPFKKHYRILFGLEKGFWYVLKEICKDIFSIWFNDCTQNQYKQLIVKQFNILKEV